MKIEHLKRVWSEIEQLGEDLQMLGYSLLEQWWVLKDLLRDSWNLGVQIVAVMLKIIPLVEKVVDRIKSIKLNPLE